MHSKRPLCSETPETDPKRLHTANPALSQNATIRADCQPYGAVSFTIATIFRLVQRLKVAFVCNL